MTEIESVEKTKKVWEVLRDDPHLSASDAYKVLGFSPYYVHYPLCEFAGHLCRACPLKGFWAECSEINNNINPCFNRGTPYCNWIEAGNDNPDRGVFADQIVYACDERIKQLNEV